MDIVLAIIWVLAMVLYSISSDYALAFADRNTRALTYMRWGFLLLAIVLSSYLAISHREYLEETGIWVFFIVVFVVILLSKLLFKWRFRH